MGRERYGRSFSGGGGDWFGFGKGLKDVCLVQYLDIKEFVAVGKVSGESFFNGSILIFIFENFWELIILLQNSIGTG